MSLHVVIDTIENHPSDYEVGRVAEFATAELFRRVIERAHERDEWRRKAEGTA